MDLTKRFCKYLKKSLSKDQKTEQKRLQDLPLEILVKMLGELPVVEAAALRDSCRSLRLAANLAVYDKLTALRKAFKSGIARHKADVVCGLLDSANVPSKVLGVFCLFAGLHSELVFLDVVLRPYRRDTSISSALVKSIASIVQEYSTALQALMDVCTLSPLLLPIEAVPPLSFLDRFLERFHTEVEIHFYFSEYFPFFEKRLLNLLFTCSRANHKITVNQNELGCFISKVYFDLRVNQIEFSLPEIKNTNTRFENEREILKFILGYLREANLMYYRSLSSEIERLSYNINWKMREHVIDKFITTVDFPEDCELERSEQLKKGNGVLEHKYETSTNTNVSKWGLVCSFNMYKNNYGLYETSNKIPQIANHCSVCTHPLLENNLKLFIYFEKDNSVVEILIYYDSILKNYSLSVNNPNIYLPPISAS